MILTSWEIACIEYALAEYKKSVKREDLRSGTESAYTKITDCIKTAEKQCGSNKMDYSAFVSLVTPKLRGDL